MQETLLITEKKLPTADSLASEPQFDVSCIVLWLTVPIVAMAVVVGLFVIAPLIVTVPSFADLQRAKAAFCPPYSDFCRPEPLEQFRYLLAIGIAPLAWIAAYPLQQSAIEYIANKLKPNGGRIGLVASAIAVQFALAAFAIYNLAVDSSGITKFLLPGIGWLLISFVVLRFAEKVPESKRIFLSASVFGIVLSYTSLRLLQIYVGETATAGGNISHLKFIIAEIAAILDGRTVLSDFVPQYQNVLGYVLQPVFSIVGITLSTGFVAMLALIAMSLLLALFVFRYITGSFWQAGLLYIPFSSVAVLIDYFPCMPLRFLGPFLVSFLCVRYLCTPNWVRMSTMLFVGALSAINNLDFGIPSLFAAMAVAILGTCKGLVPSIKTLKVLGIFSASVLLNLTLVGLVCFVRTGEVAHFGRLFEYQRMFLIGGFAMMPMPTFGMQWNLYLTFMAALLLSLWRYASGKCVDRQDRLVNGMLLFSAIFGCGASMYYVGRSHPNVLEIICTAWAFALSILVWEAIRQIKNNAFSNRAMRILLIVPCTVLAIFWSCAGGTAFATRFPGPGLKSCVAEYVGNPQLEPANGELIRFVTSQVEPGEQVSILHQDGHQLSHLCKLSNHFPYATCLSVCSRSQVEFVLAEIEKYRVKHVFIQTQSPLAQVQMAIKEQVKEETLKLGAIGFRLENAYEEYGYRFEHWRR